MTAATVKSFEISKIQDGGGRNLEKLKHHHISASVGAISTKFGVMVQIDLFDRFDC